MTDLTNIPLADLEAEIERRKEDWEAWRPAIEAMRDAWGCNDECDKDLLLIYARGLIAARPLMPPVQVDGWIEWKPRKYGDAPPDWHPKKYEVQFYDTIENVWRALAGNPGWCEADTYRYRKVQS